MQMRFHVKMSIKIAQLTSINTASASPLVPPCGVGLEQIHYQTLQAGVLKAVAIMANHIYYFRLLYIQGSPHHDILLYVCMFEKNAVWDMQFQILSSSNMLTNDISF